MAVAVLVVIVLVRLVITLPLPITAAPTSCALGAERHGECVAHSEPGLAAAPGGRAWIAAPETSPGLF